MAPKANDDVTSNLAKLSLKTAGLETTRSPAPRAKPYKKSSPIADSWEDQADDDESDNNKDDSVSGADAEETPIASTSYAGTSAPPPTPMSPVASSKRPLPPPALSGPAFTIPPFDGANYDTAQSRHSGGGGDGPSRRPEKTDAVARRMIASALGMKAPRPTGEQRAYDQAVREKERKRREKEKEQERKREEEIAKARQAIWDD